MVTSDGRVEILDFGLALRKTITSDIWLLEMSK